MMQGHTANRGVMYVDLGTRVWSRNSNSKAVSVKARQVQRLELAFHPRNCFFQCYTEVTRNILSLPSPRFPSVMA